MHACIQLTCGVKTVTLRRPIVCGMHTRNRSCGVSSVCCFPSPTGSPHELSLLDPALYQRPKYKKVSQISHPMNLLFMVYTSSVPVVQITSDPGPHRHM
eukprot:47546-Eustigmatos_ZCMA.PRE.1